ncbi:ATP-binding cassette domain-containing protein [Lactobacillus porci]|uniref:ATP-binding cassette domain-containing protein n=1 Tax=Lactobacillus porci TaxID=2012477 RepID=UPI0039954F35
MIDNLSVKENLLLAMHFIKRSLSDKEKMIADMLKELEISYLLDEKIVNLSGGEQQRVALARTILKPGKIVLADEPTGALDRAHVKLAFQQIELLRSKYHKTVLMVTHNLEQANQCDRILYLNARELG